MNAISLAQDEFGVLEEHDTGSSALVAGRHWPIKHTLERARSGWLVNAYVCVGDDSLTTTRSYDTAADAWRAWRELVSR